MRRWKNAFRLGATTEIAARLLASRDDALAVARQRGQQDHSTCQALLRIDEHTERLAAYMDKLRLTQARRPAVSSLSGLTHGQAAELLSLSRSGADRAWVFARAWLYRHVQSEQS